MFVVQSRQSRPLTRYLPVRDEPLDLQQFIEDQGGHSVQQCSTDVIVTSQTARGFLVKMGGRIRTWRRRWFVFDRIKRTLAYYVDQAAEQKRPRGLLHFQVDPSRNLSYIVKLKLGFWVLLWIPFRSLAALEKEIGQVVLESS